MASLDLIVAGTLRQQHEYAARRLDAPMLLRAEFGRNSGSDETTE